jgi:hypothetical protein
MGEENLLTPRELADLFKLPRPRIERMARTGQVQRSFSPILLNQVSHVPIPEFSPEADLGWLSGVEFGRLAKAMSSSRRVNRRSAGTTLSTLA